MYKENNYNAIDPRILNSPAALIILGKAYYNLCGLTRGHIGEEIFLRMGHFVAKAIFGQEVELTDEEFLKNFGRPSTTEENSRLLEELVNSLAESSHTPEGAIKAAYRKMTDQNLIFFEGLSKNDISQRKKNFLTSIKQFRPDRSSNETLAESLSALIKLLCEFYSVKTGDVNKRKEVEALMENMKKLPDEPVNNKACMEIVDSLSANLYMFYESVRDSINSDPCDLNGDPTTRPEFYNCIP